MVGALGLLVSVDSYKTYRNPLLQQIDQHTSHRRFAIIIFHYGQGIYIFSKFKRYLTRFKAN